MSHAAIPDSGNPVERCDEQPRHDAPHAAHATGEGGAPDIDWVARSRACSKGGERLQQLAKRATAHEEIFLPLRPLGTPDANHDDDGKVHEQNQVVGNVHIRRFHCAGAALTKLAKE